MSGTRWERSHQRGDRTGHKKHPGKSKGQSSAATETLCPGRKTVTKNSHTANLPHGSNCKATPICLKKSIQLHTPVGTGTLLLLNWRRWVWNAVGCSIDTIWGVCTVLLRSPTPTMLLWLFVVAVITTTTTIIAITKSQHPPCLTDFVLFALISNIPPLLSLLRQAGFPYHAFSFRYMQWVVTRLVQSDSTAWSASLPKWLTKEGEADSQVLFPHTSPVTANFFSIFTSPFSNLFLYLPRLKPNFHSAIPW